jgi:hypothetical protein
MSSLLSTQRQSYATAAINNRISGGITPRELNELKSMAKSGIIQLVDIRATLAELPGQSLTEAQKREVQAALKAMHDVAATASAPLVATLPAATRGFLGV